MPDGLPVYHTAFAVVDVTSKTGAQKTWRLGVNSEGDGAVQVKAM